MYNPLAQPFCSVLPENGGTLVPLTLPVGKTTSWAYYMNRILTCFFSRLLCLCYWLIIGGDLSWPIRRAQSRILHRQAIPAASSCWSFIELCNTFLLSEEGGMHIGVMTRRTMCFPSSMVSSTALITWWSRKAGVWTMRSQNSLGFIATASLTTSPVDISMVTASLDVTMVRCPPSSPEFSFEFKRIVANLFL